MEDLPSTRSQVREQESLPPCLSLLKMKARGRMRRVRRPAACRKWHESNESQMEFSGRFCLFHLSTLRSLLGSEGLHGLDSCGAAGGESCSHEDHHDDECGWCCESDGVVGGD